MQSDHVAVNLYAAVIVLLDPISLLDRAQYSLCCCRYMKAKHCKCDLSRLIAHPIFQGGCSK